MSTLTREQSGTAAAPKKATSFQFLPPANINDFPGDQPAYLRLLELWNLNLTGFTEQAMVGNTWNNLNTPATSNYYNPAFTKPNNPTGTGIQWSPFPGRFQTYFGPNSSTPLTNEQMLELADTGYYTNSQGRKVTFPQITGVPCSAFDSEYFPSTGACGCSGNPSDMIAFGPYGPRGWLDEYCEWSVTRKGDEITRIDFTCENPEYWNTLWLVSPEKVLALYRQTLGNNNIQLEDLQLMYAHKPVIDPGTGRPAYNPLNVWNRGTVSTATGGGAMHLTSTPNTLQTEIGLGAAATIPRNYPGGGQIPPSDIQSLLCSAQYGQYGRNSDPNIGAGINSVANAGFSVSLYNPPGLYIQLPPNLNAVFSIPGVSDVTPYFKVTRGGETVTLGGVTYQLNLHVTVEAPAGMPALSQLQVVGSGPLKWAGQIAQKMHMAILASAYKTNTQQPLACSMPATEGLHAQPLQLFHEEIFNAMVTTKVPNVVNFPMNLLSNSTFVPPMVHRGKSYSMVITYNPAVPINTVNPLNKDTWPTVIFDDPNIEATVDHVLPPITYAVPGNSYPSRVLAVNITITIGNDVPCGLHNVLMKDAKEAGQGPLMPALLHVK